MSVQPGSSKAPASVLQKYYTITRSRQYFLSSSLHNELGLNNLLYL